MKTRHDSGLAYIAFTPNVQGELHETNCRGRRERAWRAGFTRRQRALARGTRGAMAAADSTKRKGHDCRNVTHEVRREQRARRAEQKPPTSEEERSMIRSTQSLRLVVVGAAALALFGMACKQQEPAKEPAPPPPPEQPAEGAPAAPQQPPGAQPGPGTPAPGFIGGPTTQGQMDMHGQHQGMMNERQMCTSLAQNSNMRVEEVENGVAIILTPKQGADPAMIRQHGLHASYMIAPPANQPPQARPQSAAERCSLFDLSNYTTRSGVVEQGNEVRIILLGQSAGDVQTLRSQARLFAQEWGQGQGQQR